MFIEERTYTVRPGCVPQYLTNYETHGLELQRSILGQFIGFFYCETAELNQIVHYWAYRSLDERARLRAELSRQNGWPDYLRLNSPLLVSQENRILRPFITS